MIKCKRMPALLLVLLLLAAASTFAPAAWGTAKGFSAAELKKMSTFLSNFTEIGYMNFSAEDFLNGDDPADIIHFGIRHNYINNFKSRIALCKNRNCEWGALVIHGKYVKESIKKYFGADYRNLVSVTDRDLPYYYDGTYYHFDGADGEAVYYARVDEAVRDFDGMIVMRGEIYNYADKKDILGKFKALAKPHKYGGRNTWAILRMETEF